METPVRLRTTSFALLLAVLTSQAPAVSAEGVCDTARKIGADIRLTNDAEASTSPLLVWNGQGYGLFWLSGSVLHFVSLDVTGTRRGAEVTLFEAEGGFSSAWNGKGYGVAWIERSCCELNTVRFVRLSEAGEAVGSPVEILAHPDGGRGPLSVAWSGENYGLGLLSYMSGDEGHRTAFLVPIGSDGGQQGDAVPLFGSDAGRPMSVIWTGFEFGMSHHIFPSDGARFVLSRLGSDGEEKGFSGIRWAKEIWESSLSFDGAEYAVAWEAAARDFPCGDEVEPEGKGGIFVTRSVASSFSDPEGCTTEPVLPDSSKPRLIWNGSEFGLFHQEDPILFARLDRSAQLLADGLRVTDLPAAGVENASFTWTGYEYAVAWTDHRDGDSEIYFARVGCNCLNVDIPGNLGDEDCDGALACDPTAPWKNRGQFVSCVSRESRRSTH